MSETRAEALLKNVTVLDDVTKELVESVEKIFHIEDLYELSRRNGFIALNFFELVCNINYCALVVPNNVNPEGKATVTGSGIFGFGEQQFNFSLSGKIAAIAECFRVQAQKMETMINIDSVAAFLQATGAAQIAQDAINAMLSGGFGFAREGSKDVMDISKLTKKKE